MEVRPVDRLLAFFTQHGLKPSQVEKELGLSNAYFQNSRKRTGDIGSLALQKLKTKFLDLNLNWVITGESEPKLDVGSASIGYVLRNTPPLSNETGADSDVKNHIPPQVNKSVIQSIEENVRPKEGEYVRPYVRPLKNVRPTLPENVRPTVRPTLESSTYPTVPKVVTVHADEREAITIVGAKAAAGYLSGYGDPEYIESLPTLHIPQLRNGTYRGFEVTGESMVPTISNGAIVIGQYVERLEDIADNRLYVVVTFEDGIVVKRLLNRILQQDALVLQSDNFDRVAYPVRQLHPTAVKEVWEVKAALQFSFTDPATVYIKLNEFEQRFEKIELRLEQLAEQGVIN